MFGGRGKERSREDFLATTRRNRNNRQTDSRRDDAARVIQRYMLNNSGKRKVFEMLRISIDNTIGSSGSVTAVDLFHAGQKLLFVYNQDLDMARFNSFCQSLLDSMDKPQAKAWYVRVALNKTFAISWIKQMKAVLTMACNNMRGLKPEIPPDMKKVNLFLNVMILFTDYSLWKLTAKAGEAMKPTLHMLCIKLVEHLIQNGFFTVMNDLLSNALLSVKPKLPGYCLAATMGIRQLAICQFPSWMLTQFVVHVLSVPASMLHLHTLAPDSTKQLQKVSFVCHILNVLHGDSSLLSGLKPNESLSVFGSVVYLSSIHLQVIVEQKSMDKLVEVLIVLIGNCDPNSEPHRSSSTMWHPFFGSTKAAFDRRTLEALVHVRKQLQLLWSGPLVDYLFSPVLALTPATIELPSSKGKFRFSLFKKSAASISVGNSVLQTASQVCWMYNLCVKALTQLSIDFLIGLGCHGSLVPKMWHFIWLVVGLNVEKLVQTISTDGATHSITPILIFACQVTQHLIVTLDDEELFTQEKYFSLSELREISLFLNQLTYSMIMGSLNSGDNRSGLFSHCHSLLTLLYSRDARRSFVDPDQWLIRSLKIPTFTSELKAGKQRAHDLLSHIPHVIPHRKRLEIFRQQITEEKERLGIKTSRSARQPATYVTVHRARILDDGYAQLSLLHMKALKGTIRVKFVNEQGLEEAGIDEMGVFKEFLEEVITKAFDPELNLFKASSVGHLYPSPSSHIHENYLSLFEFVGKMLGKAVYEGIVVDVPFAPFFLSQMLGHHYTASYSCLDELSSMDPDLYKSLSYVKHTEDDVADLCLSFSWDEDFMGKVVSHELVPGGCGIPVTNENRISYVHRTAYFRMYTQLKKQSAAFIRGFHSLVDKQWMASFSPNELQRLISGDHVDLDVDDLRKHTRYYGGYHDKHKVVVWLWDILKNDFKKEEKAAFLKFVTSCSKAPLLGFSTLEPQFSIRCVEVADEQDEGDSIGSMLRGFFSVRHQGARDRLPTASTCFNLLKLPNYTRKAVLREKLRYAVTSNAGFELS